MKITKKDILIKDIASGYIDSSEEGVVGYKGKLNIRPKYQREFVYSEKQRNEVIYTILKGFPLNVMYWVKNEDGTYEILDGQQRTISFCQYINEPIQIKIDGMLKGYNNLTPTMKEKIDNYPCMIYICEGNDQERLDWFKIVNIAGERLSDQELRNANYTGEWLTDAKRYFSKNGCGAYTIGKHLINGKVNRQEYLETALLWISGSIDNISKYMAEHQNKDNAEELWKYFNKVIDWVNNTFINYREEMKGVNWGILYKEFKNKELNPKKLEKEIAELMEDEEIKNLKGIYYYVLTREEKFLNLREFDDKQKRVLYEKCKGICKKCGNHFEINEMHCDHIKPWSKGGKTEISNGQMLCASCNEQKSNKW